MKKPLGLFVAILAAIIVTLGVTIPAYAQATDTPTPTPTFTPTETLTPTATYTPSATPTSTSTLNPGITWAPSTISISPSMYNGLAAQLLATPPDDIGAGVVYAVTAVDAISGGWNVSLAHLLGVDPPYTDWYVFTDADWLGSMDCTGSEGAWTCLYYEPAALPAIEYEGGGLVFPWRQGTYAIFGELGIHTDDCPGGCVLPDHYAVDFEGRDSNGPDGMPPVAYAAAAGTVTWHCDGAHNGGLLVEGDAGSFVYFHLQPNQANMVNGNSLGRGEEIGLLAYGNFNDSPCGVSTINPTDGYHLHFEFIPSGGYLQIGGCALNMSTAQWLCGTSTIGIGGHLINTGGSAPVPTVTPGGPTVTPNPGGIPGTEGGEHIWNGLLSGLVSWINATVETLLPAHTSWGLYEWVDGFSTTLQNFSWIVAASGIVWIVPSLICYGIIMTLEALRLIYAVVRLIYGLIPMFA